MTGADVLNAIMSAVAGDQGSLAVLGDMARDADLSDDQLDLLVRLVKLPAHLKQKHEASLALFRYCQGSRLTSQEDNDHLGGVVSTYEEVLGQLGMTVDDRHPVNENTRTAVADQILVELENHDDLQDLGVIHFYGEWDIDGDIWRMPVSNDDDVHRTVLVYFTPDANTVAARMLEMPDGTALDLG